MLDWEREGHTGTTADEAEHERSISGDLRRDLELCERVLV